VVVVVVVAKTSFRKTPGHHSREVILQECFSFSLRTDTIVEELGKLPLVFPLLPTAAVVLVVVAEVVVEEFSGHQIFAFFSPTDAAEALGASIETPALSKSCVSGAVVVHAQRRLAQVALEGVITATSPPLAGAKLLLLIEDPIGFSCHIANPPAVSLTRMPSN
jgi:hypothetical protein